LLIVFSGLKPRSSSSPASPSTLSPSARPRDRSLSVVKSEERPLGPQLELIGDNWTLVLVVFCSASHQDGSHSSFRQILEAGDRHRQAEPDPVGLGRQPVEPASPRGYPSSPRRHTFAISHMVSLATNLTLI